MPEYHVCPVLFNSKFVSRFKNPESLRVRLVSHPKWGGCYLQITTNPSYQKLKLVGSTARVLISLSKIKRLGLEPEKRYNIDPVTGIDGDHWYVITPMMFHEPNIRFQHPVLSVGKIVTRTIGKSREMTAEEFMKRRKAA